ncbi:MAG: hypothetical protein ABTQ29_03325 [Siculibacillus sp.]
MTLTVAGSVSAIALASSPSSVISAGGGVVAVVAAGSARASIVATGGRVDILAPGRDASRSVRTPALEIAQIGGTLTLPVDRANTFNATLTADLDDLQMVGGPAAGLSQRVTLYVRQDETGGRRLMLPIGAVLWSDGPPDLSVSGGALDCLVFDLVGGAVHGNLVGLDYQG